jgi:chromosome segregation ATPase
MITLDNAFVLAVIAAVTAALPGILSFIQQRRKDRADLAEKTRAAAAEVIETLTHRLDEFEVDLSAERKARSEAETEKRKLKDEVASLRIELGAAVAYREECSKNTEALRTEVAHLELASKELESHLSRARVDSAQRDSKIAKLNEQMAAVSRELELWQTGKKTARTGSTGPLGEES